MAWEKGLIYNNIKCPSRGTSRHQQDSVENAQGFPLSVLESPRAESDWGQWRRQTSD